MMSFLKDEMTGLSIEDIGAKKQRSMYRLKIQSKFAIMERRFEDAIATLTKILQCVTLQYGRDDNQTVPILSEMCWCYVQFGDKKRAVQSLGRMKRINKNHPLVTIQEKLIRQMRNSGNRSRTRVEMTLCKCSNPYCSKVEHKKGEFSLCDRCESVKYCSRQCQVQHWKAGHRKQCGK